MPRPRSRWSTGALFDFIGVDHYRNPKVEDRYAERIRPYLGEGKPVVNSEFGHSAYRGDRPGHMEFGEVDTVSLALHRIPLDLQPSLRDHRLRERFTRFLETGRLPHARPFPRQGP
jgi:hypothetical protein